MMTMKEVLESAKDQIMHLDKHAHSLDKSGEFHYPLFSTNKAVEMINEVISEDITQELITRLYNLVNALSLMGSPDYNTASILESVEAAVIEARETLKKVK